MTTPIQMKVKLLPPIRNKDEMEERERRYLRRLTDLFETASRAYEAKESFYNQHQPQIHHWKTYNTIAMIEAVHDMTKSERLLMVAEVTFDHK